MIVTFAPGTAGCRRLRLAEERIEVACRLLLLLLLLLREGSLSRSAWKRLATVVRGWSGWTQWNRGVSGLLKKRGTGNFCAGRPSTGERLATQSRRQEVPFLAVPSEDVRRPGCGEDRVWARAVRGSVGVGRRHDNSLLRRDVARPAFGSLWPSVWVGFLRPWPRRQDGIAVARNTILGWPEAGPRATSCLHHSWRLSGGGVGVVECGYWRSLAAYLGRKGMSRSDTESQLASTRGASGAVAVRARSGPRSPVCWSQLHPPTAQSRKRRRHWSTKDASAPRRR